MTYLLFDSSTPVCHVTIVVNDAVRFEHEWEAGRTLARHLLAYMRETLAEHELDWSSLKGIGVFQGPGSYTGLRIGLTVLNTLAQTQSIPIIGVTGEDWQQAALARLKTGENDQIVLPVYGRDARITTPRK